MSNWQNFLSVEIDDSPGTGEVRWSNGKHIGDIVKDVDGYWKFGFIGSAGLWDDGPLEAIAAMLRDLNRDWDREIREYFDEQGS